MHDTHKKQQQQQRVISREKNDKNKYVEVIGSEDVCYCIMHPCESLKLWLL